MKRKPRLKWDPVNKILTVCSWCEREVKAMGEAHALKTPDGWKRSHGICKFHQRQMLEEIGLEVA